MRGRACQPICLLAVAIATGVAAAPPRQQTPTEALLRRVQERYRNLTDLEARFEQRQSRRPGTPPVIKQGRWLIRSPGRLRIEYADSGRVFVADGERMYWYLPEDKQVQVLPQDANDPMRTPTLYLTGRGDLLADFDVAGTGWQQPLAPGDVQLRLQPRRPGARFTHLILEVEPASATVRRLVWFGLLGESSEFRFYDVRVDVGLAEDLFRFTIPPDVRVEYLGD